MQENNKIYHEGLFIFLKEKELFSSTLGKHIHQHKMLLSHMNLGLTVNLNHSK